MQKNMATPITNIGLGDIQTEFGGTPETSLSEYYRNLEYVPVTQEKSAHHPVIIPEAPQIVGGGGINPEISLGMFRGLSKKFKHTFNITADRFTSFNLRNELIAVGWSDTTIPVDVTINISAGIYVVSNTVTSPSINASDVFPPSSLLTINNNGYIYGRGGKGGKGGIYPSTPGENGEDGGNAIETSLRTNITNNGVIAGGGGGGGGSSGFAAIALLPSNSSGDSPSLHAAPVTIYGISGGGGAPFGAAGIQQTVRSAQLEATYGTFISQPTTLAATGAGLETVGVRGATDWPAVPFSTSQFYFYPGIYVQAGNGALPGSSGQYGTNIEVQGPKLISNGWIDSNGTTDRSVDGNGILAGTADALEYGFTTGGMGGMPGFGIVGGANVTWTKIGKLKGQVDSFGKFKTSSLSNLFPSTTRSVTKITGTRPAPPQPYYWYAGRTQTTTQFGQALGWSTVYGDEFYSYSSITEGVNRNPPYTKLYNGSPTGTISYSCIVELQNPANLSLVGICDDALMSTVYVDGMYQSISGNAQLLKNQVGATWNLSVSAGIHVITIQIQDYGGNFSGHMFNIRVTAGQFNEVIVRPDEWYVTP